MKLILNNKLLLVVVFLITILISKLVIINILRIIKRDYKPIYKKFGEPTLVFTDIGRDEVAWWNIIKEDFSKYPKLSRLKFVLILSSFVFIIIFLFGVYSYFKYFVFA